MKGRVTQSLRGCNDTSESRRSNGALLRVGSACAEGESMLQDSSGTSVPRASHSQVSHESVRPISHSSLWIGVQAWILVSDSRADLFCPEHLQFSLNKLRSHSLDLWAAACWGLLAHLPTCI